MRKLLIALTMGLCAMALQPASAAAAEKGSAAEATALVKKAVAFIKANGRDKAFAEFNSPTGQFKDRDLYIFVQDNKGTTLAHGGNPRLVGKNTTELKDAEGVYFIKKMIEVAGAKGSGWVDYKWLDPVSKNIEQKSTYVEKYEDLVVGCGIYK